MNNRATERVQVVVIGGGQAGLSVGYCLAKRGLSFVILEANSRIGDSWRKRWDSLRLFTPAKYDGLIGLPFPAPPFSFPTKDEMADYLEAVREALRPSGAHRHQGGAPLARWRPVCRGGRRPAHRGRSRRGRDGHVPGAPRPRVRAGRSIRASCNCIRRTTSNPGQLRPGGVLIVGAGNSGADIALDVVRSHRVWLSGRHPGHVPFRIESRFARFILPFLFRVVFHRILTVDTPIGRRVRAVVHFEGRRR